MELITNDDQENHDAAQPRRQSNNLVSSQGGDRGRVIVVGSSKIQMGEVIIRGMGGVARTPQFTASPELHHKF